MDIHEIAKEVDRLLPEPDSENKEVALDLYGFSCNGDRLNVFAYVSRTKDLKDEWFSILAGVEFENGDVLYSDYEHSTDSASVSELEEALRELTEYYQEEEHRQELMRNFPEQFALNRQ